MRYEIIQDTDPCNPRTDYDHLGHMVCWHRSYNLGDEQPKYDPEDFIKNLPWPKEVQAKIEDWYYRLDNIYYGTSSARYDRAKAWVDKQIEDLHHEHLVILPLYLYAHGGITISTAPFSCRWDSGQVGYIYMSMADAKENWPSDPRNGALKCLKSEVEEYDNFLTGNVYGYRIFDDEGEELGSCWGYFGYDWCEQEAKESLAYYEREAEEKRREDAEREARRERDARIAETEFNLRLQFLLLTDGTPA